MIYNFTDIYPTTDDFKDELIPKISSWEVYDTTKYFTTLIDNKDIWEYLYEKFDQHFTGLVFRSSDINFIKKKFLLLFTDNLPNFYLRQQIFIANDIQDLKDWKNRGSSTDNIIQEAFANATATNKNYTYTDNDNTREKHITKTDNNEYKRISDINQMIYSKIKLMVEDFLNNFTQLFTHQWEWMK